MNISSLKKYFNYNDTLRRTVSIITGMLIILFNIASGFILVMIFCQELLGIIHPSLYNLFLYIIPAAITGAIILRLSIFMIDLVLSKVEIERYSYLRLVLMISILTYLLIFVFYFTFEMSNVLGIKIFELLEKLKH